MRHSGSLTSFIRSTKWMRHASQIGSICKFSLDLSHKMTKLDWLHSGQHHLEGCHSNKHPISNDSEE